MTQNLRKLQLTLAIIKPDVTAQPFIAQEIKDIILRNNFYFVKSRNLQLSKQRAQEFYKEHQGKFFFNRLVGYMSSGPMSVHILARSEAITTWRQLMGPTKVLRTIYEAPNSIRGRFGLTDTRNCTHGSDSEATARREIGFFFPDFSVDEWYQNEESKYTRNSVTFEKNRTEHIFTEKGSCKI